MFFFKFYFYLIFLHLIIAHPLVNLYYTDGISENNDLFYHDCLRVISLNSDYKTSEWENMFYCLSEFPSQLHLNINKTVSSLTFAQLRRRNITIQQLYSWSAPIDLIENYQIYLNQPTSLLAKERFSNCTLPKFGPKCQYELIYYQPHRLTLDEIIKDFYYFIGGHIKDLTCYVHLQCDYGTKSICLDWSDICDGQINCLNDGIDEKDCWQLEINQCHDDEHRCRIGQCIPKSFHRDTSLIPDCIDTHDNALFSVQPQYTCKTKFESGFKCADKMCKYETLTSSCELSRGSLIINGLYSINSTLTSDQCWLAFICLIDRSCQIFCQFNSCLTIIQNTCPDMIFYPNIPVLFGNIYFAYHKNDAQSWINTSNTLVYVCYNTSDYHSFFMNMKKIFFHTFTCIHTEQFLSLNALKYLPKQEFYKNILSNLHGLLERYHLPYKYTNEICNRSYMYQCLNSSKCISIHRLFDYENDCPYMDDENLILINNTQIRNILDKTHQKCLSLIKYLSYSSFYSYDDVCFDSFAPDKTKRAIGYIQNDILFPYICDGYIDLLPILVDNQNQTDETECQQWECNNIYTRCNMEFNCPNLEDEIDCYEDPRFRCSSSDRLCISFDTSKLICLSIDKINDGHIDCLGASDELFCQQKTSLSIRSNNSVNENYFYCSDQKPDLCLHLNYICNGHVDCEHGDDEKFCKTNDTFLQMDSICTSFPQKYLSSIEQVLCMYVSSYSDRNVKAFKLIAMNHITDDQTNPLMSSLPMVRLSGKDEYHHCNFGLNVRVWLNQKNQSTRLTCLCPPNYYGNQCQYQNQRISLVMKFQTFSDSRRTLFAIVILLIDNSTEKVIHSVEQWTYLAVTNCRMKFNVYLVYSTRPKDSTKEYSIHIDIYEKVTLKYRASLLYPIQFSFLPVHRLAYLITIPSIENDHLTCFNSQCIHGQCMKYWNNPQNYTFCQCDQGWSGKYCNISYNRDCSSDSKCIGILPNNRSICLCSQNQFGSRCYLKNLICQMNDSSTCLNDGECISDDNLFISKQKFQCLCRNGFSGHRCEMHDTKFNIFFEKDIMPMPKHVWIHFITIDIDRPVIRNSLGSISRMTIFQTISIEKNTVEFFWSKEFHLIFVELSKKTYYLAYVQPIYIKSFVLNRTIRSSDHCPNISKLFNHTFVQWHLIRRIKYYHLPCQNQSLNLSCFHDDVHFCLCYDFHGERLANCFQFDHHLKYNCSGRTGCENEGECFQDDVDCPTRSMCACKPCFYGRRCQYRTSGFGLSLDAILGHQISPNKSFSHQPIIVKISLSLIIIVVFIGLVNGFISLLTFKNKSVCEVGCGLYLFGLSIISIILMIMIAFKFVILLLTQMTILSNGLFLKIQCHSLDFLIQICLYFDQWLHACVAIERVMTTIQGAKFQKDKSREAAKWVMFLLFLSISASVIHDPLSRQVIIDDNENDDEIKRIWCIVRYGPTLQIYHSIIHTLHFFGPFLCNIISSIILLVIRSRQQKKIQKEQTYTIILKKQFQEFKHILVAPILLVLLALPRLILTYILKCIESENDTWLYLSVYLITFFPSMLTFVIFILPSKFYKKEFQKTMQQYRTMIQKCLCPYS